VEHRKFHIRVYVVAIGTLNVYVFHRALALFSLHTYSLDDLDTLHAHITNTCFQKTAIESGQSSETFDEDRAVMLLDEVCEYVAGTMAGAGRSPDEIQQHIWQQIDGVLQEAFSACLGEAGYSPLANAFETYGVDFVIDDDLHVWLLEFNAGPDMGQTGERLREAVAQPLIQGSVALVLEHLFDAHADVDEQQPDAYHQQVEQAVSLFHCILSQGSACR
jgi:tubulin---tyrosine ligase